MNRIQKLFLLALVCAFGLSVNNLTAQETEEKIKTEKAAPEMEEVKSPPATVSAMIGDAEVTVNYGAPSVRGRTVWGELVPYGKVWRTGANDATTISLNKDILIEGQALAAGTYAVFTIPNEGDWTVIFNSNPKQWGNYDYDEGKDVLRVEVTPQSSDEMVETMAFEFSEGDGSTNLVLKWANLHVPISITPAAN